MAPVRPSDSNKILETEHDPFLYFQDSGKHSMHPWCNEWFQTNKSWQPKIDSLGLWGKNHGVLISHNYAWCHTQFAKVVVHFAKTHMEPENDKPFLQERLTHLNKNDWNHYHWAPPTTHHHHHLNQPRDFLLIFVAGFPHRCLRVRSELIPPESPRSLQRRKRRNWWQHTVPRNNFSIWL